LPRPQWAETASPDSELLPDSVASSPDTEGPKSSTSGRRTRNAEASREHLRELVEGLGPRDLDALVAFTEFLKARRAARGFAHHHEHQLQERDQSSISQRGAKLDEGAVGKEEVDA
jgi:hypothetical protein